MRFFRHLGILLGETWAFARQHRIWWIVPLMLLLLAIAVLVVSVSTVSPFIYTLF